MHKAEGDPEAEVARAVGSGRDLHHIIVYTLYRYIHIYIYIYIER